MQWPMSRAIPAPLPKPPIMQGTSPIRWLTVTVVSGLSDKKNRGEIPHAAGLTGRKAYYPDEDHAAEIKGIKQINYCLASPKMDSVQCTRYIAAWSYLDLYKRQSALHSRYCQNASSPSFPTFPARITTIASRPTSSSASATDP